MPRPTTTARSLSFYTTCEGCEDGEVVFGGKVAQLDDAS
jgi:hypothetical protein